MVIIGRRTGQDGKSPLCIEQSIWMVGESGLEITIFTAHAAIRVLLNDGAVGLAEVAVCIE